MRITLHILIKIGQKEHIEDLQKNGTIFMNPVRYFKAIEDSELRGDPDEGIGGIQQLDNLTIYADDKELPIHKLSKEYSIQLKTKEPELSGNIYSLYSISSLTDIKKFKIHERNSEFGEYFIVIHNTKEFMNRIQEKVVELGYDLDFDLVKYYNNKNFTGRLGMFHKPNKYGYQKEFRLFIKREESSPLVFRIGSIEDISMVFKSKILESIKIESAPNKHTDSKPRDNEIED